MKKIKFSIFAICFGLILFSCSKESLVHNESLKLQTQLFMLQDTNLSYSDTVNSYLFNYIVNFTEGIMYSSLTVSEGSLIIYTMEYNLDTTQVGYKLKVYSDMILKSNQIKDSVSHQLISIVNQHFETFGKRLLQSSSGTGELKSTLFFQNSILKILNRSLSNNEECSCTPLPNYFVGTTPFWCQEDFMVNVSYLKELITLRGLDSIDSYSDVLAYLAVISNTKNEVASVDIHEVIESREEFIARVDQSYTNLVQMVSCPCCNGSATQGSDLGCCGNYSGCCWLWSLDCLMHDVACLDCKAWYCFDFCVPDI